MVTNRIHVKSCYIHFGRKWFGYESGKKQTNLFSLIFITLLGVLLFIPPFFSGLFFEDHWNRYQAIIGVSALLFILFKRADEGKVLLAPLDFTAAAMVTAYIISIFAAVNVRGGGR